jgi:hypothetical protein
MIRLVGRHLSPTAESFWMLVLEQLRSQQHWGRTRVPNGASSRSPKVKGRSHERAGAGSRARR